MGADGDDMASNRIDSEWSKDDFEVSIDENHPPSEKAVADADVILEKMLDADRTGQPPASPPVPIDKIRRRRKLLDEIGEQLADHFDLVDELNELRTLNREITEELAGSEPK